MFAFTKKQKQMKLYNKSYDLYEKLAAEYADKADEITTMPDDLREVTSSQYELDLNKLATNFDLVRDSIPDISSIYSESDVWKFKKTAHSEGRMYDMIGVNPKRFVTFQLITHYSSPALRLQRAIDALASNQSGPKLVKHVRTRVLKSLQKRLAKYYTKLTDSYGITATSPEEVSIILGISGASIFDTTYIYYDDTAGLSGDFLPRVAKHFKTNILVVGA